MLQDTKTVQTLEAQPTEDCSLTQAFSKLRGRSLLSCICATGAVWKGWCDTNSYLVFQMISLLSPKLIHIYFETQALLAHAEWAPQLKFPHLSAASFCFRKLISQGGKKSRSGEALVKPWHAVLAPFPIAVLETRLCKYCQVLSTTATTDTASSSMSPLLGKKGAEGWDLELLSLAWSWHPLACMTNQEWILCFQQSTQFLGGVLLNSSGTGGSSTPFCHSPGAQNQNILPTAIMQRLLQISEAAKLQNTTEKHKNFAVKPGTQPKSYTRARSKAKTPEPQPTSSSSSVRLPKCKN